MKHDIIDRDTGNIVGVISLSDPRQVIDALMPDINLAHRLIKELEERVSFLEKDVARLIRTPQTPL